MKNLFFLLSFLMLVSFSVSAMPESDFEDDLTTFIYKDITSKEVAKVSLDFKTKAQIQINSDLNLTKEISTIGKENSEISKNKFYQNDFKHRNFLEDYKPPLLDRKSNYNIQSLIFTLPCNYFFD